MRETRPIRYALVAVALLLLAAPSAHAQTSDPTTLTPVPPSVPDSISIPFASLSAAAESIRSDLDAAATRALQLEAEISVVDADIRAIDERLVVTAARIVEQRSAVEAAEARLAEAELRFRTRLIEVYKRGSFDPLSLLLSSDTLTELVSRAGVLNRIAEDDSRAVTDLNIAAADARYQQTVLADLQAQDQVLQNAQEARRMSLADLLAEQNGIVERLTVEARALLFRARSLDAETRARWRSASIPIGAEIPRATAVVDGEAEPAYLISAYMPSTYLSTAETFSAVCSWYGPGFNGRGSASGMVFNEDDLTCASRTLPFGTVLALTRGDKHVIVYVNDRGPYISGRDLDLSKAAAEALGFAGVATVQAEIVIPVQQEVASLEDW